VDGDIHGRLSILPGHEIIGRIEAMGTGTSNFAMGGAHLRRLSLLHSQRENLTPARAGQSSSAATKLRP